MKRDIAAALLVGMATSCGWSAKDRERYMYVCKQEWTVPATTAGAVLMIDRYGSEMEEDPNPDHIKDMIGIGYHVATRTELDKHTADRERMAVQAARGMAQCGCFLRIDERWARSFDDWSNNKNKAPPSAAVDRQVECGF